MKNPEKTNSTQFNHVFFPTSFNFLNAKNRGAFLGFPRKNGQQAWGGKRIAL